MAASATSHRRQTLASRQDHAAQRREDHREDLAGGRLRASANNIHAQTFRTRQTWRSSLVNMIAGRVNKRTPNYMDIAVVFDWFAGASLQAAENADPNDARKRETWLMLQTLWAAAARQSRDEVSTPT